MPPQPPAEWVPHVSPALQVPADRREAALDLLAKMPIERMHFTAARSYDTQCRTLTELRPRPNDECPNALTRFDSGLPSRPAR